MSTELEHQQAAWETAYALAKAAKAYQVVSLESVMAAAGLTDEPWAEEVCQKAIMRAQFDHQQAKISGARLQFDVYTTDRALHFYATHAEAHKFFAALAEHGWASLTREDKTLVYFTKDSVSYAFLRPEETE